MRLENATGNYALKYADHGTEIKLRAESCDSKLMNPNLCNKVEPKWKKRIKNLKFSECKFALKNFKA